LAAFAAWRLSLSGGTIEPMSALAWSRPSDLPSVQPEQRMAIYGVTWKDYVILREALDTPGLRMTFCQGVLELMSPSRNHELWKKTTARLLETYAFLLRLPLVGYGSTTFRSEAKERGVEPDECWRVGSHMKDGEFPDIVLEVIYASPILDKLHVYDGLDVPEVWLWKDSAFEIYRRRGEGGYDRVERSVFSPQLDFALVGRFVTREDQDVALREFADVIA
jgi:Uma2 family endonuclease